MDSQQWDLMYSEKELVWSAKPNMFLPPIVATLPVGSALDLASGEGRNAIWLANEGWDVTAVDFSAVGIEKAKRVAEDTEVNWVVADVTTYQPGRTFDLVMIVYVHIDDAGMEALFSYAVDAVTPGGTFIGVGHALRNLTEGVGGPPVPEIHWTEERMSPLVAGLDIVSVGEVLRPVAGSEVEAIDLLVHATKPQ